MVKSTSTGIASKRFQGRKLSPEQKLGSALHEQINWMPVMGA
jgi:hypothetical protein